MNKLLEPFSFVKRCRKLVGALAFVTATSGCDVPPDEIMPGDDAIETSHKALVQTSATAPAIGRNNTDGRLLVAFTVIVNGQRDIMGRLMNPSGLPIGGTFVISNSSLDESAPAVAGGSGKFLVTFTTKFSSTDTDPQAVIVDSATGAVGARLSLDASFATLHEDARAVVLSASTFHCIYRSETELFGLDVASNGVITNKVTIATRTSIQSPSLAFSSSANRFIVGWNSSRNEDIEIATRATSATQWETPNRSTWPKEVCVDDKCINSGDRVSVAWNATTSKFGVAIANDLNDGSRVEAFILPDTCSATACTAIRSRICASPAGCTETFRLAEKPGFGDVTIASAGRNFALAYVFATPQAPNESSLSVVGMDETGLRLSTTPITVQPSPVANPLVMSGSMVTTGNGAAMTYRPVLDNGSSNSVLMATVDQQGVVTGAFGVGQ